MYYISPAVEKFIDCYVFSIFILSSATSILTFYCLIKVRKKLQITMRAYFIYIQIVISLNEFHQDILFDGFPLFPQYAAFCKGVLCELKVPMPVSFGVVVLIICHVVLAVLASLSHRHQSSLPNGHRLKFNQRRRRILVGILFFAISVPCIAIFFVPIDPEVTNSLIIQSPYNLTWIQQRGRMHVMFPRTLFTESACIFLLVMLCFGTFLVCSMILHITFILRSEKRKTSVASKRIRNSYTNLSIQLSVPNLLIMLPAAVILLGLYSDKLVSFEVSFTLYYVMHLHTFVHSVMVIGLTPAYRQFIFEKFRFLRKNANNHNKTSVVANVTSLATSDK